MTAHGHRISITYVRVYRSERQVMAESSAEQALTLLLYLARTWVGGCSGLGVEKPLKSLLDLSKEHLAMAKVKRKRQGSLARAPSVPA